MPLDFTGNDPSKFQDEQQYAPGDPRAAIAAATANYQNVTANAPGPIPEMPTRPDGGFTNPGDITAYHNAMHAHNTALNDAKNYAETAKYFHDALHTAQVAADAGDFHTAFAHVAIDDPDMQDKAAAILAKSPGAASDPSVIHSLNMKLNANAKHLALNEANAKQEEAYQEKASKIVAAAKADGTLTAADFPAWDGKGAMPKVYQRNPRTGNLVYNLDYIQQTAAANKAAGQGTKSDSAEVALARETAKSMQASLADPDLDPNDPDIPTYKAALRQARLTIAKGSAPSKAAAAAPDVTPATPPPTFTPQQFIIRH